MAQERESIKPDTAERVVHWDESTMSTSSPDVFNVVTSRSEIEFLYGTRQMRDTEQGELTVLAGGRILLSPRTARGLLNALNEVLHNYESRYGSIAEAAPVVRSGGRCSRPSLPRTVREAEKAGLMLRLVEELNVRYNFERSFKMLDHALLANRFLFTVKKDQLRTKPEERILDICRRLDIPGDFLESFADQLPSAQYIHFGFEENVRTTIFKAYLEFWTGREIRNTPAGADPFLLYRGFKWDPSATSQNAISKYLCYPLLASETMRERLSAIYAGPGYQEPLRFVESVVQAIFSRVGPEKVLYLEVQEENNQRRSFDINMYKCDLRLQDLDPLLTKMSNFYRIPPQEFHGLYEGIKSRSCGHVAGGIDREGKDFLTLYYGVEDH